MVRLFMYNGYPTKLSRLLSYPQRKRVFRLCRIISKREFNRMLQEWSYDETMKPKRYNNEL